MSKGYKYRLILFISVIAILILTLIPLTTVLVRKSDADKKRSNDSSNLDNDEELVDRSGLKPTYDVASDSNAKLTDRLEYVNSEGKVAYINVYDVNIEESKKESEKSGFVTDGTDKTEDDDEQLVDLGDEKLPENLNDKEKIEYMNEHADMYPSYLIYFAGKYPETVDYVYHFPEYKDYAPTLDMSEEASSKEVPLLIQWDKRWGYIEFGNGWIGCSACGAVCMSMASLYLTGNKKFTPPYIAKYAIDNGYYIGGSGITGNFMTTAAPEFGLYGSQLGKSESNMISALENGKVIICSVAPGDFTYRGHYIVIAGYKDGYFKVNDPNSYKNSEKKWTFQDLSWQISNMWMFEKAAE